MRVLAYTGLRWGEAAACGSATSISAAAACEVVEATAEVHGKIVVGTPKKHQRRSVPIPRFLAGELASAERGGVPMNSCSPRRAAAFAPQHKLPAPGLRSRRCAGRACGLTPHELRHTAASLAVTAGANVKAVQRMLGHASAAMTLDVYAGLFGDDLDAVADGWTRPRRAGRAD